MCMMRNRLAFVCHLNACGAGPVTRARATCSAPCSAYQLVQIAWQWPLSHCVYLLLQPTQHWHIYARSTLLWPVHQPNSAKAKLKHSLVNVGVVSAPPPAAACAPAPPAAAAGVCMVLPVSSMVRPSDMASSPLPAGVVPSPSSSSSSSADSSVFVEVYVWTAKSTGTCVSMLHHTNEYDANRVFTHGHRCKRLHKPQLLTSAALYNSASMPQNPQHAQAQVQACTLRLNTCHPCTHLARPQ
jgi:hypothetical protein